MNAPKNKTVFLLMGIYLMLLPALFWLAFQYVKVKQENVEYSQTVITLKAQVKRTHRFKEECPCCYILPAKTEMMRTKADFGFEDIEE